MESLKKVYFVSGQKGGVGKSWVSASLVKYFLDKGMKIHIIETDQGNPDVGAAYAEAKLENLTVSGLMLENDDAWLEFVDMINDCNADITIVNHGARAMEKALAHGQVFFQNIQEMGASLKILWVCNNELDGLISAKTFYDETNKPPFVFVLNKFFGEPQQFALYEQSQLRSEVLAADGKEMFFPVLPLRVAATMRNERISFAEIDKLTFANRLAAKTFISQVTEIFDNAGV